MSRVFSKEQKIRFQHCDHAGIVFYPRFFVMLNDLVEDWFEEELGFSFREMHPNFGVPTVNVNTNFKNPARIGDIITKSLHVSKLGEKSVVYQYTFKNQKGKTIIEGEGTLVNIGKDENGEMRSIPWLPRVKKQMERYVAN